MAPPLLMAGNCDAMYAMASQNLSLFNVGLPNPSEYWVSGLHGPAMGGKLSTTPRLPPPPPRRPQKRFEFSHAFAVTISPDGITTLISSIPSDASPFLKLRTEWQPPVL